MKLISNDDEKIEADAQKYGNAVAGNMFNKIEIIAFRNGAHSRDEEIKNLRLQTERALITLNQLLRPMPKCAFENLEMLNNLYKVDRELILECVEEISKLKEAGE